MAKEFHGRQRAGAHQGRMAERKAMIDGNHALPISRQAQLAERVKL